MTIERALRDALREVRARNAWRIRLPATAQLPRELAARAKAVEKDRVTLPVDVLEVWLRIPANLTAESGDRDRLARSGPA